MNPFYRDYEWKEGAPKGVGKLTQEEALQSQVAYRIVSDPYRKRLSIEKYARGVYDSVIYDSYLLDFRTLREESRSSVWQREILFEKPSQIRALIRDQDDRVVLIETQYFDKGFCRECQIHSPQGILLSVHRLSYTILDDEFDGVVLYDSQNHIVMTKKYEVDEPTGQFTLVHSESW